MQVVLRTEGETEVMTPGTRASTETDPERGEEARSACTCQSRSNFNHIRYSLGASLTGYFPPHTLRLVYDRMLAWMVPSSTYPDGQLALVVRARGRVVLVFLFRRSWVVAQGKCRVGGSAETLQCKRQIQAFPASSPQPSPSPILREHHDQMLCVQPRCYFSGTWPEAPMNFSLVWNMFLCHS